MRGTDYDRFVIGEQHRGTVGGEDAEQQIGRVGHQRVGTRASVLRPGPVGDDPFGRMDLMDSGEFGVGKQRGDGEAAVAGNRLAVVIAAVPDVEPSAFPDRHAAAASKEAVRELAEADGADHLDGQRIFLMMMSSSAWLPTMKS